MEPTVTVKFRWTADEAIQAYKHHLRHVGYKRQAIRVAFILVLILLPMGILFSLILRIDVWLVVLIVFGVGAYVVALCEAGRRFALRTIRRRFQRRTNNELESLWHFSADDIVLIMGDANTESPWARFLKVVLTPAGMLIYPSEQLYHWVPRHAFANDAQYEQVVGFARRSARTVFVET
jgi:hypothetical protein